MRAYEKIVRPGHVVLDIGANVGAHALPLARLVGPEGRVICFEPTEFAFRKLVANAELNPDLAARMTLVQAMLVGAVDRTIPETVFSSWPLALGGDQHELHGGRPMTSRGARATIIDGTLVEAAVDRVDFVKLDVDGHECSVLQGATGRLRQGPPRLMELVPDVVDETEASIEELVEIPARRGSAAEWDRLPTHQLDGRPCAIPSGIQ